MSFYDYPALPCSHVRITNPIESTFAPVSAQTDITPRRSRQVELLAMIYNLTEAARRRWRKVTGAHLVVLVRAGARFVHGELVEGSEQ